MPGQQIVVAWIRVEGRGAPSAFGISPRKAGGEGIPGSGGSDGALAFAALEDVDVLAVPVDEHGEGVGGELRR